MAHSSARLNALLRAVETGHRPELAEALELLPEAPVSELLSTAETLTLQARDPEQMGREQMGYYSPRERLIVVRESPMLQMTKTLAHELGHHFAGHGAEGDATPREEEETVAESVSYVTLAHFGLDSGARSFPYIATWSRDQKLLRQTLGTIQRVSATIIDRVEGHSGQEHPQLS